MSSFGWTYTKIGTIQRRLAWPLRKDDTQNREAFHIFCIRIQKFFISYFTCYHNFTLILQLLWLFIKVVESKFRTDRAQVRTPKPTIFLLILLAKIKPLRSVLQYYVSSQLVTGMQQWNVLPLIGRGINFFFFAAYYGFLFELNALFVCLSCFFCLLALPT